MSKNVWASKEDAIEAIRRSDWAKLKEPHIVDRTPFAERFGILAAASNFSTTVSGMSEAEKTRKKFGMFVGATLKSFHRNNPKAFRVSDEGLEETELSSLSEFLAIALDNELADDFGDVPDFKLS